MTRGTFANIRLKNLLAGGKEGWFTHYFEPGAESLAGKETSIFEAASKYMARGIPTIVIAGKEYGTGSSRDWAAKGPLLLGVQAAIAESFERIHRSNLVGMGVLPLRFKEGQNAESLGLDGSEVYTIEGLHDDMAPKSEVTVKAKKFDGSVISFTAIAQLNTPVEVNYYRNRGILQTVLRNLVK
jgi:aconitate hydratase